MARKGPCRRRMVSLALSAIMVLPLAVPPARAEQVNQPTFNPRQTEKYFDDLQRHREPTPAPNVPYVSTGTEVAPAGKPLFVLRAVVLMGATTLDKAEL